MLYCAHPLTAAATELLLTCLELAADGVMAYDDEESSWREDYPRSARCFTRALARTTLLDLRDKLQRPEAYLLTDYHWLLLYECLQIEMALLNDLPLPCLIAQLRAVATVQDALYLTFAPTLQGEASCHIDVGGFVETYFWDTDFLLTAELMVRLSAEEKQQLGFSAEWFGVIHGLAPHPEELVLRHVAEVDWDKGDEP